MIAPRMSGSRPGFDRGWFSSRCISSNSMPTLRCFSTMSSMATARSIVPPRARSYSARSAAASRSICSPGRYGTLFGIGVVILSSAATPLWVTRSFVFRLLRLSGKPRDVICRQALGGAQERCQLDGMAFDDVGDVGRHASGPRQQVVGIATDDLGDCPHLVLGRRRKLVTFDL